MTSTLDVGRRLVELCRAGKNVEAVDTLYAPNVVSTEVFGDEHMPRRMEGVDAIRRKNQWWLDNHEIHRADVSGPYPHGSDRFAVRFSYDVTNKPSARRMQMDEVAVFTVQNGKIVKEEFFYDMG